MAWVFSIISIIIGAGMMFGAIIAAKKLGGSSSKGRIDELLKESAEISARMEALQVRGANFGSKAQVANVENQIVELSANLQSQKDLLKEIEQKLETAQRDVETKESAQQEMKSAKEEDETRLGEIMSGYEQISGQSVSLEQELAQSLKSLDTMVSEVPMTADQKAVFTELSSAMTNAGSRLRDLITDYQAVNERLENLKLQHADLEEEYTKLVEQQLGA